MLPGQGMHQQMSLNVTVLQETPLLSPTHRGCPCSECHSPARAELQGALGQGQLGWGSVSSHDLPAGRLLRPNPALAGRVGREGTDTQ